MKIQNYLLYVAACTTLCACQDNTIKSPNSLIITEIDAEGIRVYYGKNKDNQILSIPDFSLGDSKAFITDISKAERITYDYQMPAGKRSHCTNEANQYRISLQEADGELYDMILVVANDGFAFRYESPYNMNDRTERTTYEFPEGTERYVMEYNQSYEDFFPVSTTGENEERTWGYPALFHEVNRDNDCWVLLSEADVKPYNSASYLSNKEKRNKYKVVPAENHKVHDGEWTSPWRVAIIGSLATVVESTLITDLSPAPAKDVNYDWVKPGSVSWIYWAHNHGSRDFQLIKQYIDMAQEIGLPYMLIDAEWDQMGNGGDIYDAIEYAKEKGVKLLLWYNSSTGWTEEWGAPGPHKRLNDPDKREEEFKWLEYNGFAGVKIDFFNGDNQETMEYCIDLLNDAAKHNLLVNFHGATIPRGWQRTYPNLMTVEGVYGAEWYNNKPTLTNRAAAHNATLPFTRNVIGPMDYTPCTFSDSQHPHITTYAHELALPVLYESALTHWADRPESYLSQPKEVQEFMRDLPTVWDDTKLIAGYPGDYVVLARRSGDKWWIAMINGLDYARDIEVDWSALGKERRTFKVFEDSPRGEPWTIYDTETLPTFINLKARGGMVIREL